MSTSQPPHAPRGAEPIAALRGADAIGVDRRVWAAAGVLVLGVLGVLLVVSFVSATNDNARITRMKDRGIPVVVTVSECIGNLGGSGSNAADYTCTGRYVIAGVAHRGVIGAATAFSPPGRRLRAIADPARPSTVELASAVASARASASVYVVPGLLGLALIGASVGVGRLVRRTPTPVE